MTYFERSCLVVVGQNKGETEMSGVWLKEVRWGGVRVKCGVGVGCGMCMGGNGGGLRLGWGWGDEGGRGKANTAQCLVIFGLAMLIVDILIRYSVEQVNHVYYC